MIIKKIKATAEKPNEQSIILDYPMPSEDTGISYQNLHGRFPEKGWYRNKVCQEIFFVTKGTAVITIDDTTYDVAEGDVVILKPDQKHFGIYNNTSLITITSPNWYEEQSEIIEE